MRTLQISPDAAERQSVAVWMRQAERQGFDLTRPIQIRAGADGYALEQKED